MVHVTDPGAIVNAVSGALMAALGALLVVANPRKDWNRIFALLAVFWGAQIVAANAVRVVETEPAARLAGEMGLAFLLPIYFFVVMFAAVFPRPRAPFGTSPVALALLLTPAIAAIGVLFAAGDLLLADVQLTPAGGYTVVWGAAFPSLVLAPLYGAFFYALFTMMRRLGEARSGIERRQVASVLAAIALFVAYNVPQQLLIFGKAALGVGGAPEAERAEAILIALTMLVGLALLIALSIALARRARAATDPVERREVRLALAAVVIPFTVAVAATGLAQVGGPRLELLGIFRAGSVALIVYAIARYQLFDVDLRVKSVAAASGAGLAVGVLATLAWILLREASVPTIARGGVALLVAAAAVVPAIRISYRLADRLAPAVSRDGDHLYLRKLEVYRATIEDASASGRSVAADDAWLSAMRARLGLAERDHGVVMSLVASRAEPARSTPNLAPGGVAFGRYAVESVLARGGYGRVLLARDRVLDRRVVIKELLAKWRDEPAIVQRFLREAQLASRLQHPHIVSVHDVVTHGEDHYIVMEHMAGGSLADRLGAGTPSTAEAIDTVLAILDALSAAHEAGIVHRDVKAGNVLLGSYGEIKLADFGIAQLVSEDPQRTMAGLTTDGFQPGTLAAMSPEQARGLPVDARSDLYAVGALLHRMLAGRPHVNLDGLDALAARNAVADARPPRSVAGVQPELGAVVARALAKEPAARFPTARAFADALVAASHGGAR